MRRRSATQFPTTSTQISQITAFAASHSTTIPDPEAMAVEVKMSWVEASTLPSPSNYITITATIPAYPTYNPSSPSTAWTPLGQKTVQMALVGLHVDGFTAGHPGHPEGIWATWEHQGNAPSVAYSYLSTSGVKTVNPDFSQAWLFCAANPLAGSIFNQPHMHQGTNPAEIDAISGFTISPSNTMRVAAWGAAANAAPNPIDAPNASPTPADLAASNSEIISINDSVHGLLNSADLRRKYIMTGATWTIAGGSPSTNFGNPQNFTTAPGTAVGTNQMANTTLETYQQGPFSLPHTSSFSVSNNNCFTCHTTNTTSVSHVYPMIKPLFL